MRAIISFTIIIFSQTAVYAQKNSFEINYTAILSKLLYKESFDDFHNRNSGPTSSLYFNTKMNKPLSSTAIQFSYHRKLSKKFEVGIWGRELIRGLKSPYTFNINMNEDPSNYSENYGGYNLIYRYNSYELGLSTRYLIFQGQIVGIKIRFSPALDIYNTLQLKSNSINRNTGIAVPTGNVDGRFNSGKERFFKRIKDNLDSDRFKLSLYTSLDFEFKTIVKGLFFTSSLEFGGSTPLKTKEEATLSFLPDGWIILGNIDFGLAYKF